MCGPQIYKIDIGGTIKISLECFKIFTKHFINNSTSYLMFNSPGSQIICVCLYIYIYMYITRINISENRA